MRPLSEVIDEMLQADLIERPIEFSLPSRTERIMESRWEHAVLFAIAEAPDADEAVLKFLQPKATREANRARAIFALRCLSEGAEVSAGTAVRVFHTAQQYLEKTDDLRSNQETCLDKAMRGVLRSRWAEACRDHFLETCLETKDANLRVTIARSLLTNGAFETFQADEVDELRRQVPDLLGRVRQAAPLGRLEALFGLLERFYHYRTKRFGPRGGTLHTAMREEAVSLLLATATDLKSGPAIALAATWALGWLAEARTTNAQRDFAPPNQTTFPRSLDDDWIWTEPQRKQLRSLVANPSLDDFARGWAALLLTSRTGKVLVPEQVDWMYQLATIADGNKPIRDLPPPKPVLLPDDETALRAFLAAANDREAQRYASLSLGRLGCYLSEMAGPLRRVFQTPTSSYDERAESLVYLIFLFRTLTRSEKKRMFFSFSRSSRSASDDDKAAVAQQIGTMFLEGATQINGSEEMSSYHDYCMFAILATGDVATLLQLLRPGIRYPEVYALGLAGNSDRRGLKLLNTLVKNPDPAIKAAAANAKKKSIGWKP